MYFNMLIRGKFFEMGKKYVTDDSVVENYVAPIRTRDKRVNLEELLSKIKVDKKKEREQSFIVIASVLVIMIGGGILLFY